MNRLNLKNAEEKQQHERIKRINKLPDLEWLFRSEGKKKSGGDGFLVTIL